MGLAGGKQRCRLLCALRGQALPRSGSPRCSTGNGSARLAAPRSACECMRLPSAPDERRSRMIDIRGLLVVSLIGLVVITAAGCGDASRATAAPPAAVVKVEPVVERDVPISVEYVGALVGYIHAQIRARVAGHLVSQNYTEGSPVKAGGLPVPGRPKSAEATAEL